MVSSAQKWRFLPDGSAAGLTGDTGRWMGPRTGRLRRRRRGGLVAFALALGCLIVGCGTSGGGSDAPDQAFGPSTTASEGSGAASASPPSEAWSPSGAPPTSGVPTGPGSASGAPLPAVPSAPLPEDGTQPRLLWSEEFEGPTGASIDPSKWLITTGGNWGPTDVACYTSNPRNVALDGNGHLTLTAIAEESAEPGCAGTKFSSGRVETRGKASWKYGYFEFRARLPIGTGTLPALWLLGPNGIYDWPRSGEIDVVEATANEPATVHTNIVGVDRSGSRWEAGWWGQGKAYVYAGGTLSDRYHTYALGWGPDSLDFYFDGMRIRHIEKKDTPVWLWNRDFYIIMDIAVSAKLSPPLPPASAFPQVLSVDYVRIYDRKP
ncbi:glycoside hydrolase family 16 protein [Frankia gtarii]|uniref:glycoside hydrolase family 16 protein n=1 Tax=Frankia gtarii TaxID=2950102 RepID=UPI0034D40EED